MNPRLGGATRPQGKAAGGRVTLSRVVRFLLIFRTLEKGFFRYYHRRGHACRWGIHSDTTQFLRTVLTRAVTAERNKEFLAAMFPKYRLKS
ncbi:MAG: hypothetical protein HY267_03320 [Deltaproteobacteria bacterium]|nr:hypothetical protein [Deltaproteobacteria bacterium]